MQLNPVIRQNLFDLQMGNLSTLIQNQLELASVHRDLQDHQDYQAIAEIGGLEGI